MKDLEATADDSHSSIEVPQEHRSAESRGLPPARHRVRPMAPQPAVPSEVKSKATAASPSPNDGVPTIKDYEVGYGRPPKAHQWPKGTSGYPRGRKKGSKNVGTILKSRLNDRVKTKVNGKLTTETALEAIIRGQVYDALSKRDHKTVVYLLASAERLGLFDQPENPVHTEIIEDTDAEIVRRLMDRFTGQGGDQ